MKRSLEYRFLKKLFQKSALLSVASHHFLVGAAANPPNYDNWKWSTDKGALFKITSEEIHTEHTTS